MCSKRGATAAPCSMRIPGGVSSSIRAVLCLLVTACIAGRGFSTSTSTSAGYKNVKPMTFVLNVKNSKHDVASSPKRRAAKIILETPGKDAARNARATRPRDNGGVVVSSGGGHDEGQFTAAQSGRVILSGVEDADDKKAWVLVTPLEEDVVKEVADELRVFNSEGGEQYVGEIATHFAILLRVGHHQYCQLERRADGVTAASIPPSEVKDRAVGTGASVTSPLEDILGPSFFVKEAGREFALATNNCCNFAHNFYRAFCRDSAPFFSGDEIEETDDVERFRRWVEPMPRQDGF